MSESQRRKGKAGEKAVRDLFADRDWQVFPRPRGESGDDMTVIDKDGRQYSVEVKNTRSLSSSMYAQCKRQASSDRILAWHPSGWDFPADSWLIFVWRKGEQGTVRTWRLKGDRGCE